MALSNAERQKRYRERAAAALRNAPAATPPQRWTERSKRYRRRWLEFMRLTSLKISLRLLPTTLRKCGRRSRSLPSMTPVWHRSSTHLAAVNTSKRRWHGGTSREPQARQRAGARPAQSTRYVTLHPRRRRPARGGSYAFRGGSGSRTSGGSMRSRMACSTRMRGDSG
jgi:hypothetical protein